MILAVISVIAALASAFIPYDQATDVHKKVHAHH